MIFGQTPGGPAVPHTDAPVPEAAPAPMQLPPGAQQVRYPNYHKPGIQQVRMLKTGYKTHLNPFCRVMPPIMAQLMRLNMPKGMQPGLPNTATPGPSPDAPVPAAGPTAGAFGAAGAMHHMHRGFGGGSKLNPYRNMRNGMFPNMTGSRAHVRYGVTNAGRFVRTLSPQGSHHNVGTYASRAIMPASAVAATPAPAAPAMPSPAAGPTAGWGYWR